MVYRVAGEYLVSFVSTLVTNMQRIVMVTGTNIRITRTLMAWWEAQRLRFGSTGARLLRHVFCSSLGASRIANNPSAVSCLAAEVMATDCTSDMVV